MCRAIFALLLGFVAMAPPSAEAKRHPPQKSLEFVRKQNATVKANPMVFYVATGGANACGPGCARWIAAEGAFDRDAAQRFREFLAVGDRRKLPIFFQSRGGMVSSATAIGRRMRELGMTAGVARTIPRDCEPNGNSKSCNALKRSGHEVAADLRPARSYCASACVYAFVGAPFRQVAPGAILAVHASTVSLIFGDGRITLAPREILDKANQRIRDYLKEMGVGPGLFEAAMATPHEKVHMLTRGEITRFGLDARDLAETTWFAREDSPARMVVHKSLALAERNSAISRELIVSCAKEPEKYWLGYEQTTALDEPEKVGFVRLEASGRILWLHRMDAQIQVGVDRRYVLVDTDRVADMIKSKAVEITEEKEGQARTFKLSTAGLSEAFEKMKASCNP